MKRDERGDEPGLVTSEHGEPEMAEPQPRPERPETRPTVRPESGVIIAEAADEPRRRG